MFCFKCGQADQSSGTYCRQCGTLLPDPDRPAKKVITPQEHVTANLVLSCITVAASFTLAALLYIFVAFREGTHPLIYATSGLLIAIGAWQIQTVWRSWQLRKHFKSLAKAREINDSNMLPAETTVKLLDEADLAEIVPMSVTENTTRQLSEIKKPST